ncbi:hypothetical protein LIER_07274 [Lithospermum erythrorhizon]|uniref:Uncharacterized protein n=1 Tax=Lithospermum erythrorhizon TaxID=34254 RepID=A0AAV3PBT3_LITER
MPQEKPNLYHILDGVAPISQIANSLKNGEQSVDIMAVVIKADPCQDVTVDSNIATVQNFKIVDTDLQAIKMSVWREIIFTIAPLLVEAANNNTILLSRRLKITRYGVLSLRSKIGTLFAINLPVESAMHMKSWFNTVRDDVLPQLLEGKSISKYRDLVYDGSMKIHTVSELQNETEVGDYWIRGFLQIYDSDQKLYYIGCVVSCMRSIVIMSITDNSGSSEVVAVGNVAERIMQTTPERISELRKMHTTMKLQMTKAKPQITHSFR